MSTLNLETQYVQLIQTILAEGTIQEGRNGRTISITGAQLDFQGLRHNQFPLLIGRKIFYSGIFGEMAAFVRGPMHVDDFKAWGCNYWDKWADENGTLRLDYGNGWFANNQIEDIIHDIKHNPHSRRHLLVTWRHENLAELSLPCCHYAYQWLVRGDELDMIWIQRSVDTLIGLPSDFVLAALFNIIMANLTGYNPGVLVFQLGDVHIYEEHLMGAIQYVQQFTNSFKLAKSMPEYEVQTDWEYLCDFEPNDIKIKGYRPEEAISFLLKE